MNHPLHDKIAGVLQSGWDVAQSGQVIHVVRLEPVSMYPSNALPLSADTRREIVDESKESIKYEVTIEIGERVTEEKFRELQAVNDQTEKELRNFEYAMRGFAGKGDFSPKTPKDEALYREYQQALQNLPYHRLPDLYDSQNSYYVMTSRPYWTAFYYPREERESMAVLENIYSFAETYPGKIEPFLTHHDTSVFDTFTNQRDYDSYRHNRNRNLPGKQ